MNDKLLEREREMKHHVDEAEEERSGKKARKDGGMATSSADPEGSFGLISKTPSAVQKCIVDCW